MANRPNNRSPHRLIAPILSGAVLVALIGAGTLRPSPPAGMDEYIERVVHTIDDAPYRIGGWTGRDLSAPPTEAVDMLRPSRVLHRGYRHDGNDGEARLVIVHCPDVRDMAGHHPPNCYPATGWTTTSEEAVDVSALGQLQPVVVHRFERIDGGMRRQITVASGFLVPGAPGRLLPDMQQLRSVAENRRQNRLGAAQVQIIFDRAASQDDVKRVLETFLPALEPIASRVTEGVE